MVISQLWIEVQNLKGRTLRTLDQRKPFDIVTITENTVLVLPHSTRKERPLPRTGIENAYRHLLAIGRLTLAEIEKEYAPYNPVYVAAILAELPGVKYKLNPIALLVAKEA
jgi:hypothetical protein